MGLTKMDQIPDSNLTEAGYENIYDIGIIDQCIESFVSKTQIARSWVFPVINYTGPSQRNLVIEKLCLDVLGKAVTQAKATLKSLYRHHLQVVHKVSEKPIVVLPFKSGPTLLNVRECLTELQATKKFPVGDFQFVPPFDDEVITREEESDFKAHKSASEIPAGQFHYGSINERA